MSGNMSATTRSLGPGLLPNEFLKNLAVEEVWRCIQSRDTRRHRALCCAVEIPAENVGKDSRRCPFSKRGSSQRGPIIPNICTLHDIGETRRQHLSRKGGGELRQAQTLKCIACGAAHGDGKWKGCRAQQFEIAEGVGRAHAKGIRLPRGHQADNIW